jgi:transposase
MRHDTAGDPITGVKWSRRTTRKIAEELTALGIAVSKNTVGRLLKQLKFKLRVNRKQIASTKNPDLNQQFLYIGQQRLGDHLKTGHQ